jgi:hypothetical protein
LHHVYTKPMSLDVLGLTCFHFPSGDDDGSYIGQKGFLWGLHPIQRGRGYHTKKCAKSLASCVYTKPLSLHVLGLTCSCSQNWLYETGILCQFLYQKKKKVIMITLRVWYGNLNSVKCFCTFERARRPNFLAHFLLQITVSQYHQCSWWLSIPSVLLMVVNTISALDGCQYHQCSWLLSVK